MTSLMDVMFLVLVFFIYCIFDMAVHKGLKVDLPNAAGADEKGERIVITIKQDDSIQLNGADGVANPMAATAGIGEALITTAGGLIAALILLFPYNVLAEKAED